MEIAAPEKRKLGIMLCTSCREPCTRYSWTQLYCEPCSAKQHAEVRRKWDRRIYAERRPAAASAVAIQGRKLNEKEALGLADLTTRPPHFKWFCRVMVPFQSSASKNYIYGFRQGGHVHLREDVRTYRDQIGLIVKNGLKNLPLVHNKLWIEVFIQKPNHQCDAINFVDMICDSIKRVIPVDDRWFSILRLDWQIVKEDPMIFIGIGQEDVEDAQICSSCGRILPFSSFGKHKARKLGLSRNCRDCLKVVK